MTINTLRMALIILSTGLALGATLLIWRMPIRADMRRPAAIVLGLAAFFVLFFVTVRILDEYALWLIPEFSFALVGGAVLGRLGAINRAVERNRVDPWLEQILRHSLPPAGVVHPSAIEEESAMVRYKSDQFDDEISAEDRHFLDNFFIADEADLGPQELDLEHLDKYIFTSRHGYLVHDVGTDKICDVLTITPGMSVGDLVAAANAHLRNVQHEQDSQQP